MRSELVPYLDVAGARIAYQDHGGDGPPVFFSHGLLMDRSMFDPQVDELSSDFRCITWDERGHGDTTQEGSWTFWDSARDLVALMDHLDIARAVLVGMSQGGFLSLRAALLAPERAAALAFIDSQAGPESPDLLPVYRAMVARWLDEGGQDIVDSTADVILGPADHSPWIEKWLARDRAWVVEPLNTLAGREDLHDRLGEITCPAHVIHGSNDLAISGNLARSLCAGLPNCDGVTVIEGGGHASNLSHPTEVNRALRSFLERL